MKKFKILVMTLTILLLISCSSRGDKVSKKDFSFGEKITKSILSIFRSGNPIFLSKKNQLAKELYSAIYSDYVDSVKAILDAGADPNYCRGESGWVDSNPLNVVADDLYDPYYRRDVFGEKIPDPTPDVVVLNLLVKAGADINRRPYVWERVNELNNKDIIRISHEKKLNGQDYTPNEIKVHIDNFVKDSNRLLEAFLKAGADVDKKGHPYPFSYEGMKAKITDKEANEYFAKGSRAINIAIEKGSAWESQVDLLLKYTKLDEESLKAANQSNDPNMVKKITKLWQEQQKKN